MRILATDPPLGATNEVNPGGTPMTTRPSHRVVALAAALTVALSAGACSRPSDDKADTTSGVVTTVQASTGVKGATDTGRSQTTTKAERTVIATSGDPASPAGGIEVSSLKRDSGQLATLRFALVNNGAKDVTVANRFGGAGSRNVSGTYLVDPDGLKKYLTVEDAAGDCLCTSNMFNVGPGERLELFATFPAPPPEVKAVTVVVPSFQPVNGVPLS